MFLHKLIFFIILALVVYSIQTFDESFDWSRYLEEYQHSLYGTNTNIFIAKRNTSVEDPNNATFISYYRSAFIVSGTHINHVNVKLSPEQHQTKIMLDGKEKNPDVIYLKILVTVDFATFELHKKDFTLMATYISALFNAVDLRFRQMSEPQIRLNIAGLIIPEEPNSTIYLESYDRNMKFKICDSIINNMDIYFNTILTKKLCKFDIIFSLVNVPILHQSKLSPGRAAKSDSWKKEYPLAVIYDNGSFQSVNVIARAIAVILNAVSDSHHNDLSLKSCLKEDDYLMGKQKKSKNGLFWSNCSISAMQNFLRNPFLKRRLRKKPVVGRPLPKILPGKILNRIKQCQMIHEDYISYEEDSCWKLDCKKCNFINHFFLLESFCTTFSSGNESVIYPAEGTSCGTKKTCLNGECVHDSEL